MKASELRVGNLVNYRIIDEFDKRKEWLEVSQIDHDDLRILEIENENNQDYQPIKLTEEWLLKLGFSEYKDFGYSTKQFDLLPLQGFSYNLKTKKIMIMQKGNIQSHWLDNEVNYVHQLQNLYFALTERELIFKAI